MQAVAAAVVQQRGDARQRQVGEFSERRVEQIEIARQQRAQDQARGELAGDAQMMHQALHVLAARARRDVHGGAIARLDRDALGTVGAQPVPRHDELRQGLGKLCHQRGARSGRQILQHQHRLADRGEMAVTLDDAVPGERRELGVGIFDQLQRCRSATDFGDGGADRYRQRDAAGDRALHLVIAGGDDVDEIGIDQQRRMFEHGQRHGRLVRRQRPHDRRRSIRAARKSLGHRLPHQRRGIVEQHQQRAFGGDAVVMGKV